MREKLLLNEGWKFHLGDIPYQEVIGKYPTYMHSKAKNGLGAAMATYFDGDFRDVKIPHDYVLEGEISKMYNETNGSYLRDTAWYRRHFHLPCKVDGKRFILLFDGAGKKTTVWCNGCPAGQNQSLYNTFYMDITPYLLDDVVNTISVKIENDDIEGWWYEGAGIYRDVWLVITDEISVDVWGTYVHPEFVNGTKWNIPVETTVFNCSDEKSEIEVVQSVANQNNIIVEQTKNKFTVEYGENLVKQQMKIENPDIWDLDTPNLYNLKTEIFLNEEKIDDYDTSFGFRTISYDCNKGFFLNGKSVKHQGLCYHHDHSNVGIALSRTIYEHRILEMKKIGANAYRSAHNPIAPGVLDICDKHGIMVMDENRWLNWSDKTQNEIATMIKTGRNHPSVVLWSIANEEPVQNTQTGGRLVKQARRLIRSYDKTRPTTIALNGGFYDSNAAQESDVVGVNYNVPLYDTMHKTHPTKPIMATETSMAVGNRGKYFESYDTSTVLMKACYTNDYDVKRGLATGSSCADTIKGMEINDYMAGTYIWTGQDYRGGGLWPKVINSTGSTDTCGFEKDKFFFIKSMWNKEPMVHVFPHWSLQGKEGEEIKVVAYNNAAFVELIVNGKSLGKQKCERYAPPQWQVVYEPGYIEAIGYDENGNVIAKDKSVTTYKPAKLILESYVDGVTNTGEDFAMIKAYFVDKDNNFMPTMADTLQITNLDCQQGEIVSVCGSDNFDHTNAKSHTQKMFNGLLQVLVRAKEGSKSITIKATAKESGLSAEFKMDIKKVEPFARLAGGDRKMSIESFKIWPTGKGFDDVEAIYNFDDMNSSEFILFENYEADKKLDYLVFTARAVFPETERKMSMEFAGISGEWEMKIYHDEETWPNPDPVEFITVKKHEIFDEKTDFVVPLEGFASYERMKIVLVCKNDGKFNMDDVLFKLI